MKTVTSTVACAIFALAVPAIAGPKMPPAKLLDMYAVKEGDSFIVHIIANGDISQFLSDRSQGPDSYGLTLDVPALAPVDSKYDVETPFSRRFQVWPMQLENKIYSRIQIELDLGTSSVVGMQNSAHLFVRIQRDAPPPPRAPVAESAPSPPPEEATPPEIPPEDPSLETRDGDKAPEAPRAAADGGTIAGLFKPPPESGEAPEPAEGDPSQEELFYNLFPAPARQEQTLFNVAVEDLLPQQAIDGIRVGRFALQPSIDASWLHGSNLLLRTADTFVDNGYLVRGRVVATLLESLHQLELVYEGRFRDFEKFTLEDRFTHFADVRTRFELSARSRVELQNHFVHGSFESQEFDLGREVVASTDLFYRNFTRGLYSMDVSERLGAEFSASYNRVEFLEQADEFFDYQTTTFGTAFLYHLSPLSSLVGRYVRVVTPAPADRPHAQSYGDSLLFGLRGEITPLLRGDVQAGYSKQTFDGGPVAQSFTGFVADVRLTRDFGERAALTASAGRRTNPSSFEQNGFYVSNYGRLQFVAPVLRNLRLTANASIYDNDYRLESAPGIVRGDRTLSGTAGVAYFLTPLTFVSFDYRHDRRTSTLEIFEYRNNAFQVMVGFGFLNR